MLACGLTTLAAVSSYWKFSPFISLRSISSAIENQNAAQFETYMDYHRLRESIAHQLKTKITQSGGAAGASLASPDPRSQEEYIDAIVEAAVRPKALMQALATGSSSALFQPTAALRPVAFEDVVHGGKFTGWKIEATDPNVVHAYATVAGTKHKQALSFVFERNGFANWKIVHFVLPTAQTFPAMAQGSTGSAS